MLLFSLQLHIKQLVSAATVIEVKIFAPIHKDKKVGKKKWKTKQTRHRSDIDKRPE